LYGSSVLTPNLVMYGAPDSNNNVHVYGLDLGNMSGVPTPVQIGSFSVPLAQWCGNGGNSGGGTGGIGSAQTDATQPRTLFVVLETAGPDGTCFTSDDVYQVVHYTDSSTTAPTTVSITPVSRAGEVMSPLISTNGALEGLMLLDASNNLYFYKDDSFTSPSILVPGAQPATISSVPLPIDFPILGAGASSTRFLKLSDASGSQYLYGVTYTGGAASATKIFTGGGSLSIVAVADASYFYFTDTMSGATANTVNFVRLPLNGAATPLTLSTASTNDLINLVGSDGNLLVYADYATPSSPPFNTSTSLATVSVSGGSPTTIASFSNGNATATLVGSANASPSSLLYISVGTTSNGLFGPTTYSSEVLTLGGSATHTTPNSIFLANSVQSVAPTSILQVTGISDTNGGDGGGALSSVNFATSASTPVTLPTGSTAYTVPANYRLSLASGGAGTLNYTGAGINPGTLGVAYSLSKSQIVTFGFTNTSVSPFF
jgi:hypothetical protein